MSDKLPPHIQRAMDKCDADIARARAERDDLAKDIGEKILRAWDALPATHRAVCLMRDADGRLGDEAFFDAAVLAVMTGQAVPVVRPSASMLDEPDEYAKDIVKCAEAVLAERNRRHAARAQGASKPAPPPAVADTGWVLEQEDSGPAYLARVVNGVRREVLLREDGTALFDGGAGCDYSARKPLAEAIREGNRWFVANV